eukprot:symbB.v1.2.016476.t1/scaffold1252.1/size200744/24
MCKPSSLVPNLLGNLGSIHDTNFKAIQMVETGTVDLQLAQKWTANLHSQGFCVRMKALLPVEIETGLFTLLVNATRGQMMEQRLVALPPAQVLMGDLKMLVGNIGQLDGVDPEKPMCRIFLLLGPPVAKGLGDREDLSVRSELKHAETKRHLQAGGVRGSAMPKEFSSPVSKIAYWIIRTCFAEFEEIYNLAMSLTVENDHATVVRVKNGFHSPAAGGYCDLKLFLLIAHDKPQDGAMVGSKVCHICELQVHLKQFLACKKYTHLPYVIDRGDFDQL